jgi:pimeloyl-ACP methyl ester carboxylesterase
MRLHLEITGDGEPVLLLHGVTGSSATYRWLELDGALRLDFRGHGASERAPGSYRIADYVADAVSVLEQPAVLVGHSLGGVVAWCLAQTRPDLVQAAFLEDPPLYLGEPEEHVHSDAIPEFRETRDRLARGDVRAALEAQPDADALEPDALAARAYSLAHVDLEVFDRVIDGSLLAGTDTASPVTVPVFILAADPELGAFAPAHEARLARSHPQVEVVRLAGAGHSIHDERAHRAAYVQHLRAFLTRARGPAM